jgi:superfamily II DNA or RNA helicase
MIIDSQIRIRKIELRPSQLGEITKRLTIANPTYTKRLRLGLSVWGVDPKIKCFSVEANKYTFPRGILHMLSDVRLVDDQRTEIPDGFPLEPASEPRDYQLRAARSLVFAQAGLCVAACGAGKTILAVKAITLARQRTLILVPTEELVRQWADVIERELGFKPKRGARKRGDPRITISTIQRLVKRELPEHGCLVVDEAHHVPATTFDKVVARSSARYRWALTATPDRPDGLGPVLGFAFGPVVATITAAELVERGVLLRPNYRQVKTGWGSDCEAFVELVTALTGDPDRNGLIATLANEAQGPTLVLVARALQAETLAERIPSSRVLTGSMAPAERAAALADVRSGAARVLVATTLADEGLDLPCLETLILATPGRSEGRLEQRIGRVCRVAPGKSTPTVIDLVDDGSRILLAQARARARLVARVWGVDQ